MKDEARLGAEGGAVPETSPGAPTTNGPELTGEGGRQASEVSPTLPFAFPARKQLPKRPIQDILEEQSKDEDREAKRKKEEGESPGGGRERESVYMAGIWKGGGLSDGTGC